MSTDAANSPDPSVKTSPQFIQSIRAGLRYWQQKTEALGPEQVHWLDQRRKNLHQAILFGLNQPETWEDTAQLLLQAFDFSEWRGYWPEWIPVLEQALANGPETETVLYGRLQNRLGQFYRLDNRLTEADIQHRAALDLAQRLVNNELLVITYNCLAEYHLSQGNVAQTREYGQATLDLAQTVPSLERMVAFAHLSLGKIEEFVGNWSAAITHYQQANRIWRKLDYHTYLARSWVELGNVYSNTNEFGLAQEAYEEALAIIKLTNNDKDKAQINIALGTLYYRQEKWDQAERVFLEIDAVTLREQNEFGLLGFLYNNLGNVYLKMGRWEKASEYLNLAIEIFRQRENELALGNSLGTLASVYEQEGKQEKALQLYDRAIKLLQRFPESQWAQKLSEEFGLQREQLLHREG